MAYDVQPAARAGARGELLFAPRLDNLASCHAAVSALAAAREAQLPAWTNGIVLYDHEEVGSRSARGRRGHLPRRRPRAHRREREGRREAGPRARGGALAPASRRTWRTPSTRTTPTSTSPGIARASAAGPVLKVNADQAYASDAPGHRLRHDARAELRLRAAALRHAQRPRLRQHDRPDRGRAGRHPHRRRRQPDALDALLPRAGRGRRRGADDRAARRVLRRAARAGRGVTRVLRALRAQDARGRAARRRDAQLRAPPSRRSSRARRGTLSEREIEPVDDVPDAGDLRRPAQAPAPRRSRRTVVIKLNGGLGTSMGMTRAKSLLPVKDGLSFLDVIARQIVRLRERHGVAVPLVLMDSFRTHADSLAALARYGKLSGPLAPDFLQHKVPRIARADLTPVRWPAAPEHEWCPPGHGDIYPALLSSGELDAMLAAGYRTAFVSNADNLGAVLDLGAARLVRRVARALRDGGEAAHARRPQGRPPRAQPRRAGSRCARSRSARRTSSRASRTSRAGASSTPTTCGSTSTALHDALAARGRRAAAAADPEREAGGSRGPGLAARDPARDGDGRGDRAVRRRARGARARRALRAGEDDGRSAARALRRLPARRRGARGAGAGRPRRRHRGRRSTRSTSAPSAELERARRTARPRCVRCRRLVVRGDVRFGSGVVIEGDVTLEAPPGGRLDVPDGARLRG